MDRTLYEMGTGHQLLQQLKHTTSNHDVKL